MIDDGRAMPDGGCCVALCCASALILTPFLTNTDDFEPWEGGRQQQHRGRQNQRNSRPSRNPFPARSRSPSPSSLPLQGMPDISQYNFTSNVPFNPNERPTKYFIMKSYNPENVFKSLRKGAWATLHKNEDRLNEAFDVSVLRVCFIFHPFHFDVSHLSFSCCRLGVSFSFSQSTRAALSKASQP